MMYSAYKLNKQGTRALNIRMLNSQSSVLYMYGETEANVGQGDFRVSPGLLAWLSNRIFYMEVLYLEVLANTVTTSHLRLDLKYVSCNHRYNV